MKRMMYTVIVEVSDEDADLLLEQRQTVTGAIRERFEGTAIHVVECHEAPNFKPVDKDLIETSEGYIKPLTY